MKNDAQIQKDVMAQLNWEPVLNAAEIGVSVKDGVVTLSGIVDTYTKKLAAERVAKGIAGVRAVAEDIQVGVSPYFRRTDTEIAEAVLNALKWHTSVNENKIKIKVEDGFVTLDGEVEWDYQRRAAKTAIENLSGIRAIYNFISVKPGASPVDIKKKISDSFHRMASVDSEKLSVDVIGSKAILRGRVHSIKEREDAADVAWAAPGIINVDNQLEVVVEELVF
jgi:osmotically-inducible protein OsmY